MRHWVVQLRFRSGIIKRSKVTQAATHAIAEYKYKNLFPTEFTSEGMYTNAVPVDDYKASAVLKMELF